MERAYHERCRTAGEYRLYTGFDHVEDDVDDDACHEMCPTAGEYRLYTRFDHVEDDVDDVLVSSLSASNWAGTPSKERRLQKSARSGERPAPGSLFS